jgi:leader peptidase (prepilin peptidase) / N-methyltransferase
MIYLFLFIIGTAFGSFLSVVTNRTLKNQSGIFFGKSICPKCKHHLQTLDLIPLLSYLIYRGKCRYCHKKISIEYPLLELATGFIFVLNYYLLFSPSSDLFLNFPTINAILTYYIYSCLITLALFAISFCDLKAKEIPNSLLYTWIIICFAGPLILTNHSPLSIGLALSVCLLLFGGQWLLSKGRWIGSGDIYFAIGMSFLLGLEKTVIAILITYILGSLISIILLLTKIAKRKDTIAFIPFLAFGTLISFYFGNQLYLWYITSNFFLIS